MDDGHRQKIFLADGKQNSSTMSIQCIRALLIKFLLAILQIFQCGRQLHRSTYSIPNSKQLVQCDQIQQDPAVLAG